MNKRALNLTLSNPLMMQVLRFGLVGVTAAAVHFSTVLLLVETFSILPLVANLVGFIVSFQLSYWGHRRWTFSSTTAPHREAAPKLLLVQTINFSANETLFYIFLTFNLPYQIALFLVLAILPLFTFCLSKLWIFR